LSELYPCCCSHVASASGSAWKEGKMDFTGSQMIVTLKIISAAVSYQDGLKNEKVPPLTTTDSSECAEEIIGKNYAIMLGKGKEGGGRVLGRVLNPFEVSIASLPLVVKHMLRLRGCGKLVPGLCIPETDFLNSLGWPRFGRTPNPEPPYTFTSRPLSTAGAPTCTRTPRIGRKTPSALSRETEGALENCLG
jgi:hypothetical protein